MPRTGGVGLSDGGYSSENKQVRENLTGGLTEVPDRHAHTSNGGGEQKQNDNSGAPDANALPAGNTSTIVAGQSRSLQQQMQQAQNTPLAIKGAQAASTPRAATDLSDFINTNPGESFGKGKQTSYLIQKAGNSDIYFVYQKADLHKHYGSRSAYIKMDTKKLGESHTYKQVRVLSNGDKVVAYAKTSVGQIAHLLKPLPRSNASVVNSLKRRAKKRAGESKSKGGGAGIPAAPTAPPVARQLQLDPAAPPAVVCQLQLDA